MTTTGWDVARQLLTTAEVAKFAGLKESTIHQYRHRNAIPAPDVYMGRTPLWACETIATWIKERKAAHHG